MKFKLIVLSLSTALLVISSQHQGYASTDSHVMPDGTMMKGEEMPKDSVASKAVGVGNKVCPVSGEKVGEMGEVVKHEYKGKIYNLCCTACLKDFKKDPEKYSVIAETEVKEVK